MSQFTVLYFASAKDASKAEVDKFEWSSDINAQVLTRLLVERHPALAPILKTSMFAVNMEYMDQDQSWTVQPGDEVAVIPPVSGG
ncbi:molybdopterin synthase small subunit [Gamsiella multidivaricata]|uniref:molybdopterin synthase small subunit n=1 Tax=Gamsiella multidivaricata TaxID=101098 RepID=UPI0022202098|nr:molybdopterin synthase small subunit [Gamsiella multidivaricata]KAG0370951.1 Molybdopterin synthase catalytic subunit [Gamsiella multidivaricata]KAI7826599.1 molybdopterin synthase small subunit [Gamsiella multidivaricata]